MLCTPNILWNFISPVTGRVLATTDYVLYGDAQGIATPSPILLDLRLDLIQLRYDFDLLSSASFILGFPNLKAPKAQVLSKFADGFVYSTGGIVSTLASIPTGAIDLQKDYVFVGDEDNHAKSVPTIELGNLPALTKDNFWVGDENNRPKETSIINGGSLYLPWRHVYVGNLANNASVADTIGLYNLPPLHTETMVVFGQTVTIPELYQGTSLGQVVTSYDTTKIVYTLKEQLAYGNFILSSGTPEFKALMLNTQFLSSDPQTYPGGIAKIIAGSGKLAIAKSGVDYVNTEQLEQLNQELSSAEERITALQSQLTSLEAQVAALDSSLATLGASVAGISASLALVEAEIIALQAQIAAIGLTIAGIVAAASALQAQVVALAAELGVLEGSVNRIQAQVNNLSLNNIPATGDVSFDNFKLINLASPLGGADGANKDYVDLSISNLKLNNIQATGNVNLSSYRITSLADPTSLQDAATKHYTDNAVAAGTNAAISNLRLNLISASNNVSFYNYKGINLADPTSPQDAATKNYSDLSINNLRLNNIQATGNVNLSSYRITSLANPTSPQDAATKNYTDASISSAINTLTKAYCSIFMKGNTVTTNTANINTFYKANGTTSLNLSANFASAVTNRITYTGPGSLRAQVFVNATFSSSTANLPYKVTIYKNGAAINALANQSNFITMTTFSSSTSVCSIIPLSTNDYLEVFIASGIGSVNLTLTDLNFMAVQI